MGAVDAYTLDLDVVSTVGLEMSPGAGAGVVVSGCAGAAIT
jgi:hypothetical protein